MKKWRLVLLVAALLGLGILMTGCGKKTINLNDYVRYSFSGYNGRGVIEIEQTGDELIAEVAKAMGLKESDLDNPSYEQTILMFDITEAMGDGIRCDWDRATDLSNGDTVHFHWDLDQDILKELNKVSFTYKDIEDRVSGLEEISMFDPFEDVEINVSGTSPSGTVQVTNRSYPELYYSVSPSSGLSNGDVLTISLDSGSDDLMISQYGALPSRTEMTYTVEGLAEYIGSYADVSDELKGQMLEQLDDFIVSSYADDSNRDFEGYEVLGYYFLTPKGAVSTWNPTYNQLYLVYKIDLHTTGTYGTGELYGQEYSEDVTAYKYLRFTNLMKYPDGSGYVDLLNYTYPVVPGLLYMGDEDYYFTGINYENYAGFTSLSNLENQCINSQKADWVVENEPIADDIW